MCPFHAYKLYQYVMNVPPLSNSYNVVLVFEVCEKGRATTTTTSAAATTVIIIMTTKTRKTVFVFALSQIVYSV